MLLLRLLFFWLFVMGADQPAKILVHPVSKNALNNERVVFYCEASKGNVKFYLNSTDADEIADNGMNIKLSGVLTNTSTGTKYRILTLTALTAHNHTNVSCRAYESGEAEVDFSNTSVLLVQGPLSSVVGLSYSFIDSSTVNISWSPPFTLPGTDITGYSISATSNGSTTNYFTSDSYYVLLLTDITDSPCNEIIITVSGYNGLNGENDTLSGIYLPAVYNDVSMTLKCSIEEGCRLIQLVIDVSSLCPREFPSHANVSIVYDNGSVMEASNVTLLQLSPHELITSEPIAMTKGLSYTITLTFVNLHGKFFNTSKAVNWTNTVSSFESPPTSSESPPTCCESLPTSSESSRTTHSGRSDSSSVIMAAAIILSLFVLLLLAVPAVVYLCTYLKKEKLLCYNNGTVNSSSNELHLSEEEKGGVNSSVIVRSSVSIEKEEPKTDDFLTQARVSPT